MPFRICLVGCGYMAENGHGTMLRKYAAMRRGVELASCCDIDRKRAESFASSFGFGCAFTDIAEMLDTIQPDAVLLAVPVALTGKLAVEILNRRIPLLTEKPPGVSLEQGRAIADAARAAGVPASAAFNRRTMPLVQALEGEVEAAGHPIDCISIDMCRVNRMEPDFSTTAIHDLDLARYLCKSDYLRAGFEYRVHGEAAPAADIHVQAVMRSGAVVRLAFLPMCGFSAERISVHAHGHTFFAELPIFGSLDAPGRVVHMVGNSVCKVIAGERYEDLAEANGFLGELVSFFDAVREGRMPEHSVEGSLQSLELMCAIAKRQADYFC